MPIDKYCLQNRPDKKIRLFTVLPRYDGWRLDRFLSSVLPRLSRSRAKEIAKTSVSFSNGKRAKPGCLVRTGEEIVLSQTITSRLRESYQGSLPVLYEDEQILVIDKPTPLACHPSARYLDGTIVDRTGLRLVHRLDRETSGVLILAKHKRAAQEIRTLFLQRKIKKRYLAWVEGIIKENIMMINSPIRLSHNAKVRVKMEVSSNGLSAKTKVCIVKRQENKTLVEIFPETGRQHQIRVHLAFYGHPILGDKLYQMGEEFFCNYCDEKLSKEEFDTLYPYPRMLLHASSIAFSYQGDKNFSLLAPMPSDFSIFLLF